MHAVFEDRSVRSLGVRAYLEGMFVQHRPVHDPQYVLGNWRFSQGEGLACACRRSAMCWPTRGEL